MKILSWNVNGIRAALRKGGIEATLPLNADIVCLQEIRATREQVKDTGFEDYSIVWNDAEKKGYSGTAIFSKIEPEKSELGMNIEKHDHEGRVITSDYGKFYLVTVYTPNSQRGLTRLDYRTGEWDVDFLKYVKTLEKKKPVIFCGDLNVAHKEIDLANPETNTTNAGFTPEERKGFDNIIEAGFIDTFREFCTEGGHYTWWSNFAKSRERNIGWRIDYFCISKALRKNLKNAQIHPEIMGSDHCPITIDIDL
jgi:exodeoxyribonuclease-3